MNLPDLRPRGYNRNRGHSNSDSRLFNDLSHKYNDLNLKHEVFLVRMRRACLECSQRLGCLPLECSRLPGCPLRGCHPGRACLHHECLPVHAWEEALPGADPSREDRGIKPERTFFETEKKVLPNFPHPLLPNCTALDQELGNLFMVLTFCQFEPCISICMSGVYVGSSLHKKFYDIQVPG